MNNNNNNKSNNKIIQILNVSSATDNKLYNNFIYSLKSEVTKEKYLTNLKYYMKFLGVTTLRELVEGKPQKIIEADIKAYLIYLRNQKKVSYVSAVLYLSSIKKFYYVNTDFQFKWDLITSYLGNDDTDDDDDSNNDYNNTNNLNLEKNQEEEEGEEENNQQDRAYTREEIQKMFNSAQDIRVKIIISLMTSSGLRHGAVNILKIRDLQKIEKYQLYQITAYGKSKKYSYKTFCSPECAALIDTYLDYRKKQGEQLKGNSPLVREQFNTNDKLKVNYPKHLSPAAIRYMINDVLIKYSSLRKKLKFDYENKRKQGKNPTMLTHGMRKYFTIQCSKSGIYPDYIDLMLGHRLPGSRGHYMIPDTQTLLEGTKEAKGYVAAIDILTINDENRLQKQILELNEKKQEVEYVIKGKLQELTEQNQTLNSKLNEYEEAYKEGRIMSREYKKRMDEQDEHLSKLEERFEMLTARIDMERKLEREFELETDPIKKEQKFDKMISTKLETIRKRSNLEKTMLKEQQNKINNR